MQHKKNMLFVFILCIITTSIIAQTAEAEKEDNQVQLKIDLPIFDFPYQIDAMNSMDYAFFHTYTSPSMEQSLAVTMGVYSSMHYGLKQMYDRLPFNSIANKIIYAGSVAGGILAFYYALPLGNFWIKENYIHSIFSRHGIDSFSGSGGYWVGVTDAGLSELKEKSPYDFIRMNVAGMEAYNQFSDEMTRNIFFYDLENLSFVPALLAIVPNVQDTEKVFGHELGIGNIDEQLLKSKYENDQEETERYLTGLDSINWTYELFHPNEPYADRGQHPSGDGSVARYITYDQLMKEEKDYLKLQAGLQYLNYLSPLLYGVRSIHLGQSGFVGNFALRHYLTSFGSDLPAIFFLRYRQFNMVFTYHSYMNYENYFPALEAELIDFSVNIGKFGMYLTPRVLLGVQPKDQQFKTHDPEFFGVFGIRVDFNLTKHVLPYFDFSVKSDGWIAGNEYLGKNSNFKIGVSIRF